MLTQETTPKVKLLDHNFTTFKKQLECYSPFKKCAET